MSRFWHTAPPFGQLVEGLLAAQTLPDEITANDCTGTAYAALAMQISFAPLPVGLVKIVKDGLHLFGAGQTIIANREALVMRLQSMFGGFLLKKRLIRDNFGRAGQVDETVEAVLQQGGDALTGAFGAIRCGWIFPRQNPARDNPVGF